MDHFDLIIVGGGVAGSAMATVMGRAGRRCLVLERTTEFADRTKGEWIAPWGVAEAERLGLIDDIARARGHVLRRHARLGPEIDPEESVRQALLLDELPGVPGAMTQRHPDLCQALLDAASEAGAQTIRGASGVEVRTGERPSVGWTGGEASALLVIAADGRNSGVRRQLKLELQRDQPHHLFSGLLVEGADEWPADLQMTGTEGNVHFLAFPQGEGRVRLYLGFGLDQPRLVSGPEGPTRFLEQFAALTCVPYGDALADATPVSPCATYPNEATWLQDPTAAAGVVFIADAAGWDDPITGQGLSVTLRDVRVLSDLLLADEDWSASMLQPFVKERAERMRRLRFASTFTSVLYNEFGPEADARRIDFAERNAADRTLGAGRYAAFVGPEVLPAEAFSQAEFDRALRPAKTP